MKNNCLLALPILLLPVLFSANATAGVGFTVLTPPGDWSILWTSTGYESITFGNGTNYHLNTGVFAQRASDPTGEWDWLETYSGNFVGSLVLANTPGVPWYSLGDDTNILWFAVTELQLKIRSTRFQATNANYLELEIVAQTDSFAYLAAYAGSPSIIEVPDNPETVAYTVATAPIQQARLIVSPQLQIAQPAPSQVLLSWPTNVMEFRLESADALPADGWKPVTNAPTLGNNDQFNVIVPVSEAMRLFRLRLQ
jgi:hypothetical protein